MATLDWSQCPAVESVPDRRSGAWVFRDTRMPVATVFENLEWVRASRKSSSSTMLRGSRFRLCSNLPPAVSTRRRRPLAQQVRLMHILFDQGVPRGLAVALAGVYCG